MIVAAALTFAQAPVAGKPAADADPIVAAAVATAITACEDWVENPASWSDGVDKFPATSGLAARGLTAQATVPAVAMPPQDLRRGLHHWRVPAGKGGIYVTTSDQLPVCHLAGGGPIDFQPATETVLQAADFADHWKEVRRKQSDDLVSVEYASQQYPRLTMTVSRAAQAGERQDRVQFLATMQYRVGK